MLLELSALCSLPVVKMADGGRSVSGNVNTGLVDGDDVDINDCFDAIEMAGERFRNEGYMEGLDAGRSVGYQEGVTIGKKQGWKIGSELGFYHGFASSWRKLAAQYPDSKQRVIKALDSLVMMIDGFPLSDPTTQSLQDQLEQIRGKFKQTPTPVLLRLMNRRQAEDANPSILAKH